MPGVISRREKDSGLSTAKNTEAVSPRAAFRCKEGISFENSGVASSGAKRSPPHSQTVLRAFFRATGTAKDFFTRELFNAPKRTKFNAGSMKNVPEARDHIRQKIRSRFFPSDI